MHKKQTELKPNGGIPLLLRSRFHIQFQEVFPQCLTEKLLHNFSEMIGDAPKIILEEKEMPRKKNPFTCTDLMACA